MACSNDKIWNEVIKNPSQIFAFFHLVESEDRLKKRVDQLFYI